MVQQIARKFADDTKLGKTVVVTEKDRDELNKSR